MRFRSFLLITTVAFAGCDLLESDPPCASGLLVATPTFPRGGIERALTFGKTGSSVTVATTPIAYTCESGDTSIKYTSRDPKVVLVAAGAGNTTTITAVGAGSTYVIARLNADRAVRDSLRVVVLPELELAILRGSEQTDTIDANLREPLVAVLREKATGENVRGFTMSAFAPETRFVLSDGRTDNSIYPTVNPTGRLENNLRAGSRVGRHAITVRAECPHCVGGLKLEAEAFITTLHGNPAILSLTTGITIGTPVVRTLIGKDVTIPIFVADRAYNWMGTTAASFELTAGNTDAVILTADGRVSGRRIGVATFRASTAHLQLTSEIYVFPALEVAGVQAVIDGSLAAGYLDGSNVRRAGGVYVAVGGTEPDWSPNGSAIILDGVYPGDNINTRHIFLAWLDGNSEPLVPSFRDSPGEFSPRFSPDGQFVYFSKRTPAGGAELWRARIADRAAERVGPINTTEVDGYPTFSPDGRYVAFIRNLQTQSQPVGDIVIMDLQTGQLQDTNLDALYVEWSPIDDRFAIVRPNANLSWELLLIRRDGSLIRSLDTLQLRDFDKQLSGASFDWSEDGRYIVTDGAVIDVETGVRAPTTGVFIWRRSWRPQ